MRNSNVRKAFDTKAEARAFVAGLKFVNDSDITVLGIVQEGKHIVVHIHDESRDLDVGEGS